MTSIRSKADIIRDEVKSYSWETFREFEKIFPCADDRGLVEVYTREYFEDEENTFPYYLEIESNEDFWNRWNKFKKLKVFL